MSAGARRGGRQSSSGAESGASLRNARPLNRARSVRPVLPGATQRNSRFIVDRVLTSSRKRTGVSKMFASCASIKRRSVRLASFAPPSTDRGSAVWRRFPGAAIDCEERPRGLRPRHRNRSRDHRENEWVPFVRGAGGARFEVAPGAVVCAARRKAAAPKKRAAGFTRVRSLYLATERDAHRRTGGPMDRSGGGHRSRAARARREIASSPKTKEGASLNARTFHCPVVISPEAVPR